MSVTHSFLRVLVLGGSKLCCFGEGYGGLPQCVWGKILFPCRLFLWTECPALSERPVSTKEGLTLLHPRFPSTGTSFCRTEDIRKWWEWTTALTPAGMQVETLGFAPSSLMPSSTHSHLLGFARCWMASMTLLTHCIFKGLYLTWTPSISAHRFDSVDNVGIPLRETSPAAWGWKSSSTGRKVMGRRSWLLCCSHLVPDYVVRGLCWRLFGPSRQSDAGSRSNEACWIWVVVWDLLLIWWNPESLVGMWRKVRFFWLAIEGCGGPSLCFCEVIASAEGEQN